MVGHAACMLVGGGRARCWHASGGPFPAYKSRIKEPEFTHFKIYFTSSDSY